MKIITDEKFEYRGYAYMIAVASDVEPKNFKSRGNFPFGITVWIHDIDIDVFSRGCYNVNDVAKTKRKAHREAKKFIRTVLT